MKVAVVGPMQSGKSTLVSAISGRKNAPVAAHIEELMVPVPDDRLDWLTRLYQPKKTVYATIDCLDLPGLSFIDEHGRSAARRLFSEVRSVDMFVVVLRAFESSSVATYRNRINPVADLVELKTEFLLADLELVTTRIERIRKQLHKPTKAQARDKAELELQLRLQEAIESEKPISSAIKDPAELELIRSLGFLTLKPMTIVVNVSEDRLDRTFDFADALPPDVSVITLCASIENELSRLDEQSRTEFMKDLGITEPASKKFVQSCYSTLGLISFLTIGKDEVRAWPIKNGTNALDAAGKVHSDIKRGFIRAETISYDDLRRLGEEKAVRAAGKIRLEGKNYIVTDGDIINFRFNV